MWFNSISICWIYVTSKVLCVGHNAELKADQKQSFSSRRSKQVRCSLVSSCSHYHLCLEQASSSERLIWPSDSIISVKSALSHALLHMMPQVQYNCFLLWVFISICYIFLKYFTYCLILYLCIHVLPHLQNKPSWGS